MALETFLPPLPPLPRLPSNNSNKSNKDLTRVRQVCGDKSPITDFYFSLFADPMLAAPFLDLGPKKWVWNKMLKSQCGMCLFFPNCTSNIKNYAKEEKKKIRAYAILGFLKNFGMKISLKTQRTFLICCEAGKRSVRPDSVPDLISHLIRSDLIWSDLRPRLAHMKEKRGHDYKIMDDIPLHVIIYSESAKAKAPEGAESPNHRITEFPN